MISYGSDIGILAVMIKTKLLGIVFT